MNSKIIKIQYLGLGAIILLPVLFTSALVIGRWPEWWAWVIFERTPMTWMESLLLFTAALTAATCAMFSYFQQNKRNLLVWLFITCGFFYLTLDERFAIHERIRDKILAPNNLDISLFFWTSSGDYILLIIMFIGLLTLPFIIRTFREKFSALLCFISAIIVSATAIIIDSITHEGMSIEAQRMEQFIEEILETTGMMLFLSSFFLLSIHYLAAIIQYNNYET